MIKIFVADKTEYPNSATLIEKILREYFKEISFTLRKSEKGKPFLEGIERKEAKFLSVSHTSEKYFVAFSPVEIGIDAEPIARQIDYTLILKKLNESERANVQNTTDFFAIWTAKESVVKYLGSTLYPALKNILFERGVVMKNGKKLHVYLKRFQKFGHIISVCAEDERVVSFEKI